MLYMAKHEINLDIIKKTNLISDNMDPNLIMLCSYVSKID